MRLLKINQLAAVVILFFFGWLAGCDSVPAFAQTTAIYAVGAMAVPGPPVVVPPGPEPAVFYSPSNDLEAMDVALLLTARRSINIAAYALTDRPIVNALMNRANAGVKVNIYRDHSEVASECRGDVSCASAAWAPLLGMPNVEIRVKRSTVLMHLKAYQVDDGMTREGSANFSPQGLQMQDNSAIYISDPDSERKFFETWELMWTRADNLTVAQAVLSAPKWARGKRPSGSPK